jgi:hypothetical protein
MSTPSSTDEPSTRRRALQSLLVGGSLAFMAPMGAQALDMDAFANSQVRQITFMLRTVVYSIRYVRSSRSRTYSTHMNSPAVAMYTR